MIMDELQPAVINRRNRSCIALRRLRSLLIALVCIAIPYSSIAQEKKNVRVVFTSLAWNSELPFRVALARGLFKAQGLEIQPIFVRGGPAAMAALLSGEVDFAEIGGAQAVMRTRARGADVTMIGLISNTVSYQLLGNKNTRGLEELRGKILGVTGAGAFSDFAMRIFLRRRGIDPDKDVTLRAIGGSALRAAALEKGLVAAAPFAPEDTVRLMRLGFPMIANLGDSLNIPQGVIATRSDVLEKYPEMTKRFLKALILGMQLTKTNKAEAIKQAIRAAYRASRRSSIMPMICMRRRCPPIWLLMCRGCSSCWTRTNAAVWSIASLHSIGSSTIGP
jgi:NitT/TauT family transport system substrate-binding protein